METAIRLAQDYDLPDVIKLYSYFGKNEIDSLKAGWIWERMKWQENSHLYVMTTCKKVYNYNTEDYPPNGPHSVIGAAVLIYSHKLTRGGSISCRLEELVINENYRGQGLGEKFVRLLEKIAEKEGCYKLTLDCNDQRLAFYTRLGFREVTHGMRKDL